MTPALRPLAAIPLYSAPTPVEELSRLRAALGEGPRLLVKRDDAIGFAFGGNKVRKMALRRRGRAGARCRHADHAAAACSRITRASPPRLRPDWVCAASWSSTARARRLTGNALLDAAAGAEVRYVSRATRVSPRWRRRGGGAAEVAPVRIPLGASTALGAAASCKRSRIARQILPPDLDRPRVVVGGTQAGSSRVARSPVHRRASSG